MTKLYELKDLKTGNVVRVPFKQYAGQVKLLQKLKRNPDLYDKYFRGGALVPVGGSRLSRKEKFEFYRGRQRTQFKAAYKEFETAETKFRQQARQYRGQVAKAIPPAKFAKRTFTPGQKGYIPLAKRRPLIRRIQRQVRTARREALAPIVKTEQQFAKTKKYLKGYGKQLGIK